MATRELSTVTIDARAGALFGDSARSRRSGAGRPALCDREPRLRLSKFSALDLSRHPQSRKICSSHCSAPEAARARLCRRARALGPFPAAVFGHLHHHLAPLTSRGCFADQSRHGPRRDRLPALACPTWRCAASQASEEPSLTLPAKPRAILTHHSRQMGWRGVR